MNMDDISNLMLKFKDAIRHAWNAYFAESDTPMSSEIQEAFGKVEIGLFQAIVLSPLDVFERVDEYRKRPLSFIIIKPAKELFEIPLQLGERDKSGNMVWQMPDTIKVGSGMTFEFYEYFDWYPYGYIDLPYVMARVRTLPEHKELEGKIVILEQHLCRFFFSQN